MPVPSVDLSLLEGLIARVEAADGVAPLNEQATRILRGQVPGLVVTSPDDGTPPLGLAVVDPAEGTGQVLVDPEHRRGGIGRSLVDRAERAHPGLAWWSFATLPPAQALAERLGLVPSRALLRMDQEPVLPITAPSAPDGIRVGTLQTRGSDIDDLVEVNALAFADHPEQGRMTRRDVEDHLAEPWGDPAGIFLARDDQDRLRGFHWTKMEDGIGEVYVIGVHPDEHGRGLGRVLLESGLAHLAAQRPRRIELYVEAANERVVRMYERAGFVEARRDTLWAHPQG